MDQEFRSISQRCFQAEPLPLLQAGIRPTAGDGVH